MKFSRRRIIILIIILAVFAISYYFISQQNIDLGWLEDYVARHQVLGAVVFTLFAALSIVIVPMSAAPLMPIAAAIWPMWQIALYFFIAWNISAWIAFWISRRWGRRVVGKFVDLEKVDRLIDKYVINRKSTWLRLLVSRIVTPFDITSYAYGLIKISFFEYVWITAIRTAGSALFYAWAPKQLNKIFDPVLLTLVILLIFIIAAFFWPKQRK